MMTVLPEQEIGAFDGLADWKEEDAKPPEHRIKNSKSAHALYVSAKEADKGNAYNRKLVQEMLDEPPYDDAELDSLGHADAVNLNFLEGAAVVESALASYNDLTSSVDSLVKVHTTYGEGEERLEWENIIAEEFSRMCREWPRFEFNVQHLSSKFVLHGVGIAYFDHDIDWRWKTSGLGDFLLPRDTEACEEEVDYAITTRSYPVHKLYSFIADPAVAKTLGWNVDAVRKSIWNAFKGGYQDSPSITDWEEFQEQIKNNDLFISHAKAARVKVNHYFIREFDGTISHYLGDEAGQLEEFLFKRESRFKQASDCFTIFTYGIGNGFYHGIRGLGFKIFPQVQMSNRLQCRAVEGGMLASSMLIQPQSATDLEALNLIYYGPYAVLPPEMKVVERTVPNFAQSVLPVVSLLSRQVQNNTGSYQPRAVSPESSGTERTKFEVQAQLQQEATLSTSAMNLFYLPLKRLLSASFRRVQNRDYRQDDPGGREVFELRRRCAARDVPMEAIYKVDRIEAVRAIGYGSPGNRLLAMDDINQLAPQFDPTGRRNALRDRVAVRVGYETANRYVQKPDDAARPPVDAKIAELENAALQQGQLVSVHPDEMHEVHLGIHMGDMAHTLSLADQGQADPHGILTYFSQAFPHAGKHVQFLSSDSMKQELVGEIEKALDKMANDVTRIQKAVLAEMQAKQAAMEEQMQAQQQGGGMADPELKKKADLHAMQMKNMEESSQMKMALKAKEADQRMHIKDVTAASNLQNKHSAAQQDRAIEARDALREAEERQREGLAVAGEALPL